uniref:Uncharacterized protein n=1 Tax=Chrysemys picta bellii TaxID=8478 RepID=A0A8C3ILY1_CHRPI
CSKLWELPSPAGTWTAGRSGRPLLLAELWVTPAAARSCGPAARSHPLLWEALPPAAAKNCGSAAHGGWELCGGPGTCGHGKLQGPPTTRCGQELLPQKKPAV